MLAWTLPVAGETLQCDGVKISRSGFRGFILWGAIVKNNILSGAILRVLFLGGFF